MVKLALELVVHNSIRSNSRKCSNWLKFKCNFNTTL